MFGYKGKQVRDNIHAYDVCLAIQMFYENPRIASVYNLGGGRENSISVIEVIKKFENLTGRKIEVDYVPKNRIGDHICYISNLSRFKKDYPEWEITRSLDEILAGFLKKPMKTSEVTV